MNRSRTISGLLCLVAISAPIVIAPFRIGSSLEFVREIENRQPSEMPALSSPKDLVDSAWWSSISRVIEDRVPMRQQMISLQQSVLGNERAGLLSEKVAMGEGQWLYLRNSLSKDLGTLEEAQHAIELMDSFVSAQGSDQQIILFVSPDKASIYPEHLIDDGVSLYEDSREQRERIQDWFANTQSESIIDVWTPMRSLKGDSIEPIYEIGGSHFNSIGAMVMGRVMINAIDPSVWDDLDLDSELVEQWRRTQMPELAKMGGYWDRQETYTRSHIQRDGVRIESKWIDGKDVDPDQPIPDGKGTDQIPVRVISSSDNRRLIRGRTLVIHDSAIGNYLRPTLAQFFEDIEYRHFNDVSPDTFGETIEDYERVFIESVERHFVKRIIWLFEPEE
jgi:SGNH hydrolase-like domain, acetyltransferase AlgX